MTFGLKNLCLALFVFGTWNWPGCEGRIMICSDPTMTRNGQTVYSRVGSRVNIAFQAVSDRPIYRYLKIEHPNLSNLNQDWYSHSVDRLDISIATTKIPNSNNYRTLVEVLVKHLEPRDFMSTGAFVIHVLTVTSDDLPNMSDSATFTFNIEKTDETQDCGTKGTKDVGPHGKTGLTIKYNITCKNGWKMVQGQCVQVYTQRSWLKHFKTCAEGLTKNFDFNDTYRGCVVGDMQGFLTKTWVEHIPMEHCYILERNSKYGKDLENQCPEPTVYFCGRNKQGPPKLCQGDYNRQFIGLALGTTHIYDICLKSHSSFFIIETLRNFTKVDTAGRVKAEILKIKSTEYILRVALNLRGKEDYGITTLRIRNGFGCLLHHLYLRSPGSPDCGINLQSDEQGIDYVRLSWQPYSVTDTHALAYVVYSAKNATTQFMKVQFRKTSVEVKGLQENTEYRFQVVYSLTVPDKLSEIMCEVVYSNTKENCSQRTCMDNNDPRLFITPENGENETLTMSVGTTTSNQVAHKGMGTLLQNQTGLSQSSNQSDSDSSDDDDDYESSGNGSDTEITTVETLTEDHTEQPSKEEGIFYFHEPRVHTNFSQVSGDWYYFGCGDFLSPSRVPSVPSNKIKTLNYGNNMKTGGEEEDNVKNILGNIWIVVPACTGITILLAVILTIIYYRKVGGTFPSAKKSSLAITRL